EDARVAGAPAAGLDAAVHRRRSGLAHRRTVADVGLVVLHPDWEAADMTSTLSRRSLLTGFVTVVVGGIAGYAVARNSDVAKGSPNTNLYGQSTVTPDNQTYLLPLIKVPRGGGAIVDAHNVVVTRDNNGA